MDLRERFVRGVVRRQRESGSVAAKAHGGGRVKTLRAAWPGRPARSPADFVFIDESGVNRAMTWLCACSLRGTRAFGHAPRHWGDNVSLRGALCLRGTLEPMCVNGATDRRVFLTSLEKVLLPQLWPGAVAIMHNLGAHKVRGVRELIEAAGACSN